MNNFVDAKFTSPHLTKAKKFAFSSFSITLFVAGYLELEPWAVKAGLTD